MEPSTRSSKRQRLMSLSLHVSPLRPDVPARFESLSDDPLTTILEFVGRRSYRSFGGLNKHCREVYLSTKGMTKETFVYGYATLSVIINKIERAIEDDDWDLYLFETVGKGVAFYNRRDVLAWALQREYEYLSRFICYVAAREGRIDILDEVWNYIGDDADEADKRTIFENIDTEKVVAWYGKLNVLKWFEMKGLSIFTEICAYSACSNGQIHILQWLEEEQGLELNGGYYEDAIEYGQLNVMRWLREKEVPWSDDGDTFLEAAEKGNLDVLQWLHDEGCPWDYNHTINISEDRVKPEVVKWCRVHGYGDRIVVG